MTDRPRATADAPDTTAGAASAGAPRAKESDGLGRLGQIGAVGIHTGRLLRRWVRSPAVIGSSIGIPVVTTAIMKVMFSGMVEQFSGAPMDMTGVAVMVAVSQAFLRAMLGAGAIVQERQEGLMQRLATLPGPRNAPVVGYVLAESLRAFVAILSSLVTGLALGASFGGAERVAGILAVMALVAVTAGAVGVMLGYLAQTPQGAVGFVPLVMAAMFFNTAMMPRDMYAVVLRPLVDGSPITSVSRLVGTIIADGRVEGTAVLVFVAWFGGLTALGLLVLGRRANRAGGS